MVAPDAGRMWCSSPSSESTITSAETRRASSILCPGHAVGCWPRSIPDRTLFCAIVAFFPVTRNYSPLVYMTRLFFRNGHRLTEPLGLVHLESSPCINETVPTLLPQFENTVAATVFTQLIQHLCRRIHYIVVRTHWERHEFIYESVEPGRRFWDENLAGLKQRCDRFRACTLVAVLCSLVPAPNLILKATLRRLWDRPQGL